MEICRCSATPAIPENPQPQLLSWDMMRRKQGVYQINGIYPNARFVVLGDSAEDNQVLLYTSTQLVVANKGAWEKLSFFRTKEKVCFEIKPA